jgi:hypothetical protein
MTPDVAGDSGHRVDDLAIRVVGESRNQSRRLAHRDGSTHRERADIAQDTHPLRQTERLPVVSQRMLKQLAAIERPVVARLAVIRENPVTTARHSVELDLGALCNNQPAGPILLAADAPADANRDLPELFRGALRAHRKEPLLRHDETRRLLVRAAKLGRDDRCSRLIEKRRERASDSWTTFGFERAEEILRRGAAVGVRRQVPLHTGLELLLAHPQLEHPPDRGALPVGDPVECVLDVMI